MSQTTNVPFTSALPAVSESIVSLSPTTFNFGDNPGRWSANSGRVLKLISFSRPLGPPQKKTPCHSQVKYRAFSPEFRSARRQRAYFDGRFSSCFFQLISCLSYIFRSQPGSGTSKVKAWLISVRTLLFFHPPPPVLTKGLKKLEVERNSAD